MSDSQTVISDQRFSDGDDSDERFSDTASKGERTSHSILSVRVLDEHPSTSGPYPSYAAECRKNKTFRLLQAGWKSWPCAPGSFTTISSSLSPEKNKRAREEKDEAPSAKRVRVVGEPVLARYSDYILERFLRVD